MKYLNFLRFELNLGICEDDDKKLFGIEKNELPTDVKEGDILSIDNDGNIKIDESEKERRKALENKKRNKR